MIRNIVGVIIMITIDGGGKISEIRRQSYIVRDFREKGYVIYGDVSVWRQ